MLLVNTHIFPICYPAADVIKEFEKAILSTGETKAVKQGSQYWFRPFYYLDRITRKAGIPFVDLLARFFVLDSKEDACFAVLMGRDFVKYQPYAFLNRKKRYIYFFDVWPKDRAHFVDFIRRYKIDRVFVSASQVAIELNEELKRPIASWIPEGIDVATYKAMPYPQKDIDIIQLGRRYDWYHDKILTFADEMNKIYLYEKTKGIIIFPKREDFINGMARAKISVCFPSNITHPERAGDVETMTNRYLQSMASKCLIVGHAPKEMIELFGYNPLIEIDVDAPVKQLKAIFDHYPDYIPLIEKNHSVVSEYHTWKNRWERINTQLLPIR
jgi:hypothetical protein